MKKGKTKWYKSISNWLILIACIILIPIIIMNLSIMMQAKKNKDVVPSVFGIKPFMVLSGSMEKEIKRGDLILTKIVDPKILKIDDVIAFRDAEGTVTTHRIIDIVVQDNTPYFITKGDNNNAQDRNLVEYKDVEGIYIGRIPGIGSLMKSLSEPTTIMIVMVGITIVFVIGFTISNRKIKDSERLEFLEYKRLKEKEDKEEKINKKEIPKPEPRIEKETKKIHEEIKEKSKEEKEREEFLEYKKMKEQEEERKKLEQEEKEFLEFKKFKEQQEKEKSRNKDV